MIKSPGPGLATFAVLLIIGNVNAEEARDLGAHEHGVGQLNIAIEADEILMELKVPGVDIVGFEYAADTAEDRKRVSEALAALERPNELFEFSPEANCTLSGAESTIVGNGDDAATGSHTEFRANYSLECADMAALERISFPYFQVFPKADELGVQLITGSGARKFEAKRADPAVDLAELI